jgi:hypothetical protein
MDTLINLYAKISGAWSFIGDWLPVIGAVGSLLDVAASICLRTAAAPNATALIQAIHPTPSEIASTSLAVGLIKAHLNHVENKTAIAQTASAAAVKALPK